MVTTKLNLSMTEPQVRQIYAKQGDTGRVLDITLDQTPEDGTLRILRPDGVEVTSEAVTGGEVESGSTFESLTEADVTELTVGIEPVQDLSHGDPSPTNICPITGHDEVTVTRTGINVWDEEWELGGISNQTGVPWPASDRIRSKNYIRCSPNTAYYFVCSNMLSTIAFYDEHYNFISALSNTSGNILITTPQKSCYIKFNCAAAYGATYNNDISINYPSTDHDYHAYQGSTYTTSLGQTVYGGTLDMASGVLTVDRGMVTLNGSETWNEWRGAYFTNVGNLIGGAAYLVEMQSNAFRWIGRYTAPPLSVELGDFLGNAGSDGGNWNGNVSFFYDNLVGGVNNFKTWVASNPIQLVYTLKTPQTYQLTPQQIKTLVGTNNVWASSGDIVNITFTYGGLLSELPSEATEIVGKCYCDVEQNGVSSMPFTLNVKKNERQ